jgi:uncharacterized protein YcfJ
MVVNRKPFSQASRVVASVLAAICLIGGGIGLAIGMVRGRPLVAVAALGILGLGVLYLAAAWRGRPLRWR